MVIIAGIHVLFLVLLAPRLFKRYYVLDGLVLYAFAGILCMLSFVACRYWCSVTETVESRVIESYQVENACVSDNRICYKIGEMEYECTGAEVRSENFTSVGVEEVTVYRGTKYFNTGYSTYRRIVAQ